MKIIAGKPEVILNPKSTLSGIPTLLDLYVNRIDEPEVTIDFADATFGVDQDNSQFYISARPVKGNGTDLLTIRGLELEPGVTYRIGDGEKDVHVVLEIKDITEYATGPVGTFTVHEVNEDPSGKIYLLAHFQFVMTETIGEKRDIHVSCYVLQILQSE